MTELDRDQYHEARYVRDTLGLTIEQAAEVIRVLREDPRSDGTTFYYEEAFAEIFQAGIDALRTKA